ncbi:MAG: class I SAM-dependent methyltransferase [Thermoflexales bacterium]|nr:class I SAM-dependent methyltransferase [Thermoflexales bacterium]MDW8351746.1 class I SAM-dependent methyltransferase [Anaerolineae bacterium]
MICDYEGSDYRTRFWENADRAYEDAVERIAIAHLLPPRGRRIAEFGAGFGRLADLYAGYDEVILLDYSRSLLEEARQRWGQDPRFKFVAADIYHLPFASGVLSAATMIRVVHHIADVPAAFAQIRRAIAPGGTFVLEFANKRNLKAMMRYLVRRQSWSPHAPEPIEFVKLNFNFHPRWMMQVLREAGFDVRAKRSASYLRVGFLKRVLPLRTMVRIDALLQPTARWALLSPSVFVQALAAGSGAEDATREASLVGEAIFRSPRSGQPLRREGDLLVCDADGTRWRAKGNFYDFKAPL